MHKRIKKLIFSFAFMAIIATATFAQSTDASSEANPITGVKKELLNGKTYTSIFMIAGVIAIVGLAIYLSFSNEAEKKQEGN